jgi:membrane protein implicated in regulation of membrane protease activity
MTTFYIICAVLGGVIVLLQSVFGLFEHGDAEGHADHSGAHDALDLVSLRSLSAGLAAFGLTGGLLTSLGLWWLLTAAAALIVGFVVLVVVATVIRQMGRLESDGSLIIEGAIGETATVYIPIPSNRSGRGKVTAVLQSQIIELEAMTEGHALPTGERVMIVDLDGTVANVVPVSPRTEGAL